jgi:peptidyl-prolyl cis-trans isomerase B (cyclophilin B)
MKVRLQTTMGEIVIETEDEKAPETAANFLTYVREGFYDGTIFHRVIDGFMIQGGGFGEGMTRKKTHLPIRNQADNGLTNATGTVAMARTSKPHSATSQFFINVNDNPFLDFRSATDEGWGYCVFGRVVEGMDVVGRIKKVPTTHRAGHGDVPVDTVVIERAEAIEA